MPIFLAGIYQKFATSFAFSSNIFAIFLEVHDTMLYSFSGIIITLAYKLFFWCLAYVIINFSLGMEHLLFHSRINSRKRCFNIKYSLL